MPTNTYVALDKVTVAGTSTSSITFNSIVATYTDLVIVVQAGATVNTQELKVVLNGDTTNNYSNTIFQILPFKQQWPVLYQTAYLGRMKLRSNFVKGTWPNFNQARDCQLAPICV